MAPRSSRVLLDEIPVPRECAARRTVSDASSRKIKTASNEWFVRFSDVTIRCVKTRETDLPGGFSRQKEKQGKQGKVKKGKSRNLCTFLVTSTRHRVSLTVCDSAQTALSRSSDGKCAKRRGRPWSAWTTSVEPPPISTLSRWNLARRTTIWMVPSRA